MAHENHTLKTNGNYRCLIVYHPDDQKAADDLSRIISSAGSTCCLVHEFLDIDMKRDALLASLKKFDCIVSLITSNKSSLHYKVFMMLDDQRKFIPVVFNIKDSTIDDDKDFEFLNRCIRIRAQFDNVDFCKKLVREVNSAVRRSVLPDHSHASGHVQRDVEIIPNETCLPSSSRFLTDNNTYEAGLLSTNTDLSVAPVRQMVAASDSSHSFWSHSEASHTCNPATGCSVLTGRSSDVKLDQTMKVAIKKFKQPVTNKYKHLVRTMKRQRSPWLVPIFKIVDKPQYSFQLVTPHMPGGNLELCLLHGLQDDQLDRQSWLISTACQISEGIAFLHTRNIVHGDINPHHVLFDQHGIVRLVDYGMYTHRSAESCITSGDTNAASVVSTINSKKCFRTDMYSFAEVVLKMLCQRISDEQFVQLLGRLQQLGTEAVSQRAFEIIQDYLEPEIWPKGGITSETIGIVLTCCRHECDRTASSKLSEKLKAIMMKSFSPALPLAPFDHQNPPPQCFYCSVQPVHPEPKFRSTGCPETCPYLCACISCKVKLGSHCHVENDVCNCQDSLNDGYVDNICPVHKCTIEPAVGGKRSFAMILNDASNDIGNTTENDAMSLVQLASHPKIMQMPVKNVHAINLPDPYKSNETYSQFKKTCERVEKEMIQILNGKPSQFLFYYSGHQIVQNENKRKPRALYEGLVETLHKFINKIANACPRILMIFDCCCASAVADLFEIRLDDLAHVEWHAQWFSCSNKQDSVIEEGYQVSAFTELVVSALKGGKDRPCPHGTENCKTCSTVRRSCSERGYISLNDAAKFVKSHTSSRQCRTQEDPEDVQIPMFRGTFSCEPVIAFFNKKPTLYTFFFESMFDDTLHRFETDDLSITNIRRMTFAHHPKDARHFKFYERYSMELLGEGYIGAKEDMSNDDLKRILDAVSKDNKCLLVKLDSSQVDDDGSSETESPNTDNSSSSKTQNDTLLDSEDDDVPGTQVVDPSFSSSDSFIQFED